jgi:glutathione S-transferase
MIMLYQFRPLWGLPSASPFCMKVETYLRMAGLPYEVVRRADIRKAPKGKFPYIEDHGRRIADSRFIIDYLKSTYGNALDAALSPAQRAMALGLQRLMEEHLYWAVVHDRWAVRAHWEVTRRAIFGFLPVVVRRMIAQMMRKKALAQLYGHGMGRHDSEEIYALARQDLDALADFLGDKPFFMGETPTSLDATAFAFLASLLAPPFDSPLKAHARLLPRLTRYVERMAGKYFPDAGRPAAA